MKNRLQRKQKVRIQRDLLPKGFLVDQVKELRFYMYHHYKANGFGYCLSFALIRLTYFEVARIFVESVKKS